MNDLPASNQGSIKQGFLLLLALHAVAALVCGLFSWLADGDLAGGLTIMLFVGIAQVVYVAPTAIVLSTKRRSRTLKGLLIGAGITFLVNATCAGLVLFSIRH